MKGPGSRLTASGAVPRQLTDDEIEILRKDLRWALKERHDVSTPSYEDAVVLQISAPPMAYLEIPGPAPGDPVIRIVHRTLVLGAIDAPRTDGKVWKELLKEAGDATIERVRHLLRLKGGGIIWWRKRPHIEIGTAGGMKYHKWRCRLGTSPDLTDEEWNSFGVPPGTTDACEQPSLKIIQAPPGA
jgi:hypothetical protein